MELCVLHHHFRPGGVRRVIELGLPALVRATGIARVVLAAGEAPPADWLELMERALHPCAVAWSVEPAFGYWSEQNLPAAAVRAAIREALACLARPGVTVWAHNLSVGRNMVLAQEVAALPDDTPLWLHHHDWWWDGRWERWPEMAGQGMRSLEEACAVTLPRGENVRHFSINVADARQAGDITGLSVSFLPNPVEPGRVSGAEAEAARGFLRQVTGAERHWLYPCRGLRRKNIAEALLVQRCLAPGAVTVTTGAASSVAEGEYLSTLTAAAAAQSWPLHAAACTAPNAPSVPHLIAAADAVVVTSLREGFGLPYYEAAGCPLAARIPAGLEETLAATGLRFCHGWNEWCVPRDLFDAAREEQRVASGRAALGDFLPDALRAVLDGQAEESGAEVDFGKLTLAAQLEVLGHADAVLRRQCAEANLAPLEVQPAAVANLSPGEWARAFLEAGARPPARTARRSPVVPPWAELLREWLRYPLLWPAARAGACK